MNTNNDGSQMLKAHYMDFSHHKRNTKHLKHDYSMKTLGFLLLVLYTTQTKPRVQARLAILKLYKNTSKHFLLGLKEVQ